MKNDARVIYICLLMKKSCTTHDSSYAVTYLHIASLNPCTFIL